MRVPAVLAAFACAAACLPVAAQQLKPGLWEISNKMNDPQMEQAMAQMQQQLAAMPPAQRQQMEAAMARQGVKMVPGGGNKVQMCMTREMVERSEVPMQDGCKVTSQSRSGNTLQMAFTCASPPSSGEGRFTFAGDQAYSSRMTVRSQVQGRTEAMAMEGTGKWLKADCGEVRPPARPPAK